LVRIESIALLVSCCLFLPACNGRIYSPGQNLFTQAISPRSQWTAGGNLRDPGKAVDGDINTAAVAAVGSANATLVIDLGKVCHLNMIVVEHGLDEYGYCRELLAEISDDGEVWYQQTRAPGLRRVTNILLETQGLARYIRLRVVTPGSRDWSVAEIYIN